MPAGNVCGVLMVKVGDPTVKDTVVVWLLDPLCPVIAIIEVPDGVAEVVVTVSMDDAVVLVGLKLAVAPVGRPEAVRATDPLNPPTGFTERW